jgi:hypothetical protein
MEVHSMMQLQNERAGDTREAAIVGLVFGVV